MRFRWHQIYDFNHHVWHPQHPVMPLHLKGGILCSKDDVKMSPSCSTILLLVHLSLIPAAKCKGSRHTKSAPNTVLYVSNRFLPGYEFLRKHPILGAINEHNSEGDASLLPGFNSFVLAAAGRVEIKALPVPAVSYAQPKCPGCTPFSPLIRLSKDVAAHDWVIDVKCSSNIKFVWNGQRKALFTVKILSKVPI